MKLIVAAQNVITQAIIVRISTDKNTRTLPRKSKTKLLLAAAAT